MADQLALLMEELRRARDIEAAAKLDVGDTAHAEEKAKARRIHAEQEHCHAAERVKNAWRAVKDLIDAQTHSMFESELE